MNMRNLYPGEILPSAYIIDYDRLYSEGIRGVCYDVDNTLVPHGAPPDNRARALFRHLHEIGMQAVFVSNNTEPRVKKFAEEVDEKYVYLAAKPSPKGYYKAMEMMGTDRKNTIAVGDQIFTDIWGANRAGIRSILVKPIHPKEEIQIVIKRKLEKPVIRKWYRLRAEEEEKAKKSGQILPTAALPKNPDGTFPEPYGKYDGRAGSMRNMQKEN